MPYNIIIVWHFVFSYNFYIKQVYYDLEKEVVQLKLLCFAIKKIIPISFSYIFLGITYGLLLHKAGYSAVWAFLSGLFIYAGSMQIVMVSLITANAPLITIAIMTFFINARHIFYGINFIKEFRDISTAKHAFWKYPYMALTVTDETYSVLCSVKYPDDIPKQKAEFYILLFSHILWAMSCTAGALIGDIIPFDMAGLEFSATAFFCIIVINQWQQSKSHLPVFTGFISAIFFYFSLGADKFIIPALTVSMIFIIITKNHFNNTGDVVNE